MDPLMTSLLDLMDEMKKEELRLIVGGGLGLYLKRLHLDEERTARTTQAKTRAGITPSTCMPSWA